MTPTKIDILKEDMALVQKRLDFLQEHVPANDIWQNQLLWEHTKIWHDVLDYILSKGEKKNEKVSESNPQSESREIKIETVDVCPRTVDKISALIQRLQDSSDQ